MKLSAYITLLVLLPSLAMAQSTIQPVSVSEIARRAQAGQQPPSPDIASEQGGQERSLRAGEAPTLGVGEARPGEPLLDGERQAYSHLPDMFDVAPRASSGVGAVSKRATRRAIIGMRRNLPPRSWYNDNPMPDAPPRPLTWAEQPVLPHVPARCSREPDHPYCQLWR